MKPAQAGLVSLGLGSNMFLIDESSGIVKTDPSMFDANLLPALGTEIRLQLKVSQQMSFCFFKSWMIFWSQGQLLKLQLLESSTVFIEILTARHEKWHLLDTQKDLKT